MLVFKVTGGPERFGKFSTLLYFSNGLLRCFQQSVISPRTRNNVCVLQFSRIAPLDAVAARDMDCLIALPSRLDDSSHQKPVASKGCVDTCMLRATVEE